MQPEGQIRDVAVDRLVSEVRRLGGLPAATGHRHQQAELKGNLRSLQRFPGQFDSPLQRGGRLVRTAGHAESPAKLGVQRAALGQRGWFRERAPEARCGLAQVHRELGR